MLSFGYLKKHSGFYLALAPFVLIALMGFSTLVVDIGILRVAKAQLQTAVDAAALAAANALPNGVDPATAAANSMLSQHTIIGNIPATNVQIELGNWDTVNSVFTPNQTTPVAARVSAQATPPLFFANMFFSEDYTVSAESTAALLGGPRDIIFIVDLSPSMTQYSRLAAYPTLSVNVIINNLQQIYNALNLPSLGNMTWTPRLINGTNNAIINELGLQSVSYPYPDGSWNDYINYVKNSPSLSATGYLNQYGYLTFVDFLLSEKPQYSQTPTLWRTPQQPLQNVKDSLDDFISTNLTEGDRIALISYNRTSGNTATVEQSLTANFATVPAILYGNPSTDTPGRQAAHYSTNSNMLSAISAAIDELNANGREEAQWMIYLFSSAQLPNSGVQAIINQVQSGSLDNITVNTITVGSSGNLALMQLIAQIGNGTNYQAPPNSEFGSTLGQIANLAGKAQLVH